MIFACHRYALSLSFIMSVTSCKTLDRNVERNSCEIAGRSWDSHLWGRSGKRADIRACGEYILPLWCVPFIRRFPMYAYEITCYAIHVGATETPLAIVVTKTQHKLTYHCLNYDQVLNVIINYGHISSVTR